MAKTEKGRWLSKRGADLGYTGRSLGDRTGTDDGQSEHRKHRGRWVQNPKETDKTSKRGGPVRETGQNRKADRGVTGRAQRTFSTTAPESG